MQILSITPNTRTFVTGRLSDGSDRQTITVTEYHVVVQEGGKYEATLQTDDTQAIADAFAAGLFTAVQISAEERITELESKLAQAEQTNITAMEAIADLYEMLLGAG